MDTTNWSYLAEQVRDAYYLDYKNTGKNEAYLADNIEWHKDMELHPRRMAGQIRAKKILYQVHGMICSRIIIDKRIKYRPINLKCKL